MKDRRRLPDRRATQSPGRRRGPKPRAGVAASNVIAVRVTDDERADLEQVARDTNRRSVADVIREAVNEYVADYREAQVFHL